MREGRRGREREAGARDGRRGTRDERRGTRDERRGTRDERRETRDERRETRKRKGKLIMKRNSENVKRIIVVSLFVIWGFIIYSNSLFGEFQFDDKPYIIENSAVKDLTDFKSIFSFQKTRGVGLLSFALNYHFSKDNPFFYHLTNLFIHLVNTFLVWSLIQLTFLTPRIKNEKIAEFKDVISFSVAILFLSHPIQTQAVTYITQRLASLATLFYLFSVHCSTNWRLSKRNGKNNPVFFALAAVSAILAMLTKEISFTLPFAIILYEIIFFSDKAFLKSLKKKIKWKYVVGILLILLIIPALFNFDINRVFRGKISRSHDGDTIITAGNYFLTQPRVVSIYLKRMFFPVNQMLDYDFTVSQSIFEPVTVFSFIVIAGILLFAILNYSQLPLVSFGLLWFFLTLSVEASIIPIRYLIFEHRIYLPSFGFLIAFCLILFRLIKNVKIFKTIILILVLVLSFMTIQRNKVWQEEIGFWEDNYKKSPNKEIVINNLAAAYLQKDFYNETKELLIGAINSGKKSKKIHCNLGEAYLALGQFELAEEQFEKALKLSKKFVGAHEGLGAVYYKKKEFEKAEEFLTNATRLKTTNLRTATLLAKIYEETKDLQSAILMYKQILKINPNQAFCWRELCRLYLLTGNIKESKKISAEVLGKVNDIDYLKEFADILKENGMKSEALKFISKIQKVKDKR